MVLRRYDHMLMAMLVESRAVGGKLKADLRDESTWKHQGGRRLMPHRHESFSE